MGLKRKIPAFHRAKIFNALDGATTVVGLYNSISIKCLKIKCFSFLRHNAKRQDTFSVYVMDPYTNPLALGISMSASYTAEIVVNVAAEETVCGLGYFNQGNNFRYLTTEQTDIPG
jgi:hypothetical protein